MNEKLQYAEMLEIPVNTCNITYKPPKKRKTKSKAKVNSEEVKAELIDKVNSGSQAVTQAPAQPQNVENTAVSQAPQNAETPVRAQAPEQLIIAVNGETAQTVQPESTAQAETAVLQAESEQVGQETFVPAPTAEDTSSITVSIRNAEPTEKPRKKFGIIAIQLCIIGVLIATIFITNALFEGSGINTFFKGVFGAEQTATVDERTYVDFTPVISAGGESVVIEDGVIVTDFVGSMYSPCDGTVSSLTLGEDGKYTVEITHNERFKTVIEGLTYVYAVHDGEVKANLPVGYVSEKGATVCFYNGLSQIINFTLNDNTVVWAV